MFDRDFDYFAERIMSSLFVMLKAYTYNVNVKNYIPIVIWPNI